MLYKNRKIFSDANKRIGSFFSRFGLSPNTWTALVFLPVFTAIYFLSQKNFLYAAFFFGIAALVDIIDGAVARAMNKMTKKGAYYDTVADRYMEGLIIFGLLFANAPTIAVPFQFWLFLYFFGSLMTTYSKAAAKEKDLTKKELSGGGLLERPDRMILLFVGILSAHFDVAYLAYIIIALAFLSNITALQRISIASKQSKD